MSQSRPTPMKSSTPRRFHTHLDGLKDEFEFMAQEIESLQRERDQYKAKVEMQAKELQRKSVCEQCTNENMGAPQSIGSSRLKTLRNATSKPVPQSKSVDKRSTSGTDRNVVPSRHMRRPAQGTTLQGLSTIEVSVPHTTYQPALAPLSSQPPTSVDDRRADTTIPDWSITYNAEVKKELDVEMVHTLRHQKPVSSVKFSQDGKYLAAGCEDGKAYIYDSQTGALTCVLKNLIAEERIDSVCFSVDGKYLATGVKTGYIYIWEIETKYVRNAFKGHIRPVRTLEFSPNGRLLLSASWDNTIRVWTMRYGAAKILTNDNFVPLYLSYPSAVFCSNGKSVAASLDDGMIRLWDVCTGQLIRKVATSNSMYGVACMGDALVVGCSDGMLKSWDIGSSVATRLPSRSQIAINSPGPYLTAMEEHIVERRFSGHKHNVNSLAITRDGRWIGSASDDRSVRVWDTRNAVTQCILNDRDRIYRVDISPTGSLLALARLDGLVRIWRFSAFVGGNESNR